ncbi:hypothetical protein GGD83_002757 [Rhodoblastus sphagnicola]|nr:hypothetical protein [Rhodoblastus sphagnicola]
MKSQFFVKRGWACGWFLLAFHDFHVIS